MMILWGWVFLMSEVLLQPETFRRMLPTKSCRRSPRRPFEGEEYVEGTSDEIEALCRLIEPLPSELGTYKTVEARDKARFLPWLAGGSPSTLLSCPGDNLKG